MSRLIFGLVLVAIVGIVGLFLKYAPHKDPATVVSSQIEREEVIVSEVIANRYDFVGWEVGLHGYLGFVQSDTSDSQSETKEELRIVPYPEMLDGMYGDMLDPISVRVVFRSQRTWGSLDECLNRLSSVSGVIEVEIDGDLLIVLSKPHQAITTLATKPMHMCGNRAEHLTN